MGKRLRASGFVLGLVCLPWTASADQALRAKMQKFIDDRKHSQYAIAVAVFREGMPVEKQVFGYRDAAKKHKVDTKTLFQIASMSKAFTSALGLILDSEGVIKMDQPISAWEPGFKLKDPRASREATIEDLLSHRSGLPPYNNLWVDDRLTREEIYAKLGTLAPDTRPGRGFREAEAYRYTNIMVSSAGHAIERALGRSWEDLIAEKIFVPLGMSSSVTTTREFVESTNKVLGRSPGELGFTPIDLTNIGPAASISSNIDDMAKWLAFHVRQGADQRGRPILAPAQHERLLQSFTRIPKPDSEYFYGLSWQIDRTYGRPVVWHTGHINHSSSMISFIPKERAGVVVLSNIGPANGVSSYFVLELGLHIYRQLGLIGKDERYGPHDRGALIY